jgi:glycosyltransferase involved in cell wall biosynthesis
MRIAIYLPVLDSIGGVELNMVETLRELAARGHRFSLFYEQPGNLTDDFRSFCESMHRGPSPRYSETPLREAPRIGMRALATARRRPDLIFANNFSELAWAAGVKALTRAPIVCHLHEFQPVRRSSLRLLGGRIDRVIVSSGYMRGVWTNHGLEPARIAIVHPGMSQARYTTGSDAERLRMREQLGIPADAYVVLYMGRLIPEKGVDLLLEAWRSLALAPQRARLLIVGVPAAGNGYADGLRAMSPPGCEWLPTVRDVVPILHAADVLAAPSRWDEPFGRVVVEALATGRPAVAAAVGGIPEILRGEFAGLLFPREDVGALARRLLALQDWRTRDPALATHCAGHVAANFSLDATVTQLEEVFAAAGAG